MKAPDDISGYRYADHGQSCAHGYLLPGVRSERAALFAGGRRSAYSTWGCGNGSVVAALATEGYDVCGGDPSTEGIAQARAAHPHLHLEVDSAYNDLVGRYGRFAAVISLEAIEHVYALRHFARTLYVLVEPGGMALVSVAYHGYWKNLAVARTGKLDVYFTALWDHGHIKFCSVRVLDQLVGEAGFEMPRFLRIGRVPPLAKSMIAIAMKPAVSATERRRR